MDLLRGPTFAQDNPRSEWTVGGAPNLGTKFSTNSEATVPAAWQEERLSPLGQISKIVLVDICRYGHWANMANTTHSKGSQGH